MGLSFPEWGQIITLILIAMALGMDAFSLGIGLGIRGLSIRKITLLSSSIGLFHVLMPLIGLGIGQYLTKYMQEIAAIVGGGMLCFLGGNMLWNSLKQEENQSYINTDSLGSVLLFSFSVSLDSLSAGLSLGLFAVNHFLAVLFFGGIGAIMAGIGLGLGKYLGTWLGNYGEAIGGMILFMLGVKFIW
ncbi:manganese efflux pump MntP [Thermoflavimicrobium dichotomicum]|uniref:Putative manganese efflux pump MntP n=1 Tax=Thermoflavimicrobium dichotomicum TaxID=46223 RepID=A0A1I3K3K6_9BACL|nr:manganese efflux pump MntP family protein [Thermoflavimicrobium dichotomicum]SFI66900.1 Putative Mn2+ efflux pump MntP [Thermoflavimicrobium dichotomicum]